MAQERPMKGEAPDPKYPMRFPLFASVKLDGIRVGMWGMTPKSNSMKAVPNKHINRLLEHPAMENLDMEVVLGLPEDPTCYSKTFSAYSSTEGEPDVTFYVFDIIDQTKTFSERQHELAMRELPPYARVVEQVLIHSQEELDALYAQVTAQGHEGLILRSPEGMYKYGRATAKSQDCLKLKPAFDSEFVIEGFFEALENQNEAYTNELGRTARSSHAENKVGKGTLGGFLAKEKYTGVQFRCAPGKLTAEQRLEIWQNQDKYKPMIGKYRSFPVGLMKNSRPRMPRWIGWTTEDHISSRGGEE